MRTYSSQCRRQRNLILYEFDCFFIFTVGNEAYIALAVCVSRTCQYARRSAVTYVVGK